MIRLLRITLRNFLSVGNLTQTINLALYRFTLVLGDNTDVAGQRNGAGKSVILQAVSYALFGEPLTDIKLDNLVNHFNNKGMLVTLEFEVNGKTVIIERGRKPNILKLFIDGSPINQGEGENKNTQIEIERMIGMSHLLFTHLVALNTHTPPFMKLRSPDQRSVIEELFGITQLSQRAAALKLMMDGTKDREGTKDSLKTVEATVKANEDANARIHEAIERTEIEAAKWQRRHDDELAALVEDVAQLQRIDIDAEMAVFDRIDAWQRQHREYEIGIRAAQQEIDGSKREVARLRQEIARQESQSHGDNGEISRLESQKRRYLAEAASSVEPQIARLNAEAVRRAREIGSKVAQAERMGEELTALQEQLEHPDSHTCSTCGQHLAGTAHLEQVMERLRQKIAQLTDELTRLIGDIDDCQAQASDIDAETERVKLAHDDHVTDAKIKATAIDQDIAAARDAQVVAQQAVADRVQELETLVADAVTQMTLQKAVVAEAQTQIDGLGDMPRSCYASRDTLWGLRQQHDGLVQQISIMRAKPNPHVATIEGLRSTVAKVDYATLNALTLRLKHEMFLYKLLTAKDSFVRKSIIDQNLSFLNKRINYYLDRLQLPHEVRFISDLSVEISFLGKDMDFDQLSRGEQNRGIVANWLAFRDVFENLNNPLNLLLIDEVLDSGLDDAGSEAAVATLQHIARERNKNVFLISHKDNLIGRADRVMLARKENQFTSFVEDYQMLA